MSAGTLAVETTHALPSPARSASRHRVLPAIYRCSRGVFQYLSLVTFLAIMTALPLVQLIAFGYLLDVAGKLTRGERLGAAVAWRETAGRLGLAAVVLFLLSLPIQFISTLGCRGRNHLPQRTQCSVAANGSRGNGPGGACLCVLAWVRGGRLKHYLWPSPILWLKSFWRPRIWLDGADRLIQMVRSLQLLRLLWLGIRGAVQR